MVAVRPLVPHQEWFWWWRAHRLQPERPHQPRGDGRLHSDHEPGRDAGHHRLHRRCRPRSELPGGRPVVDPSLGRLLAHDLWEGGPLRFHGAHGLWRPGLPALRVTSPGAPRRRPRAIPLGQSLLHQRHHDPSPGIPWRFLFLHSATAGTRLQHELQLVLGRAGRLLRFQDKHAALCLRPHRRRTLAHHVASDRAVRRVRASVLPVRCERGDLRSQFVRLLGRGRAVPGRRVQRGAPSHVRRTRLSDAEGDRAVRRRRVRPHADPESRG